MESAVSADVARAVANRYALGWKILGFPLHLAVVYLIAKFGVVWLAALIYNTVRPALHMPSSDGHFQFVFSHLLLLSTVCGFAGGLVTAKYNHRIAHCVWIVPLAVLVYKFSTFPSGVFENQCAVAFHHYLGGGFLIPEFHTYQEMFSMARTNLCREEWTSFGAPPQSTWESLTASLIGLA